MRENCADAVATPIIRRGTAFCEHGAGREEDDPEDEEGPAPVQVGELPVERHGNRHAEHIGGEDPGVLLEPAQVLDDPRRGGGDDRLVQRRDEHA
jgi:hypothetical protein